MSAEKTAELMMPVMMSLKKVHSQGRIHRDISPDNIMLVGVIIVTILAVVGIVVAIFLLT